MASSVAVAHAAASPIAVRQVQADYRSALMERVCAQHLAGAGDSRLRIELRRFRTVTYDAERHGLGGALQATKREWDHFQKVADWVCAPHAGVAKFRGAIDRLERSVDAIIRHRGHR